MIIVKRKYIPTDASVIRAIALAKGISEQGEKVRMIFLMPNNGIKYPYDINNVSFEYIGESSRLKNKYLCLILSIFKLNQILKKRDIVILMSFILPLYVFLSLNKRIKLFHERTEYPPFVMGSGIKGKIKELVYVKFAKRGCGIFVISKGIKEYLISKGVDAKTIYVINMVVDSSRFDIIKKNQLVDDYIAYCGTVSNYKDGVNYLLKAFSIVSKKYPDLKLYILGKTVSESDRKENEKIIREENIESKVYMPGIIDFKDMPQYLVDAKLLVLARPDNIQAKYGFPTKLGEYLLSGNPVVVTEVGEIDSFLGDKKSCVFAKPNDVKDIANKILWVLENPLESSEIGQCGKRKAQEYFNYKTEAAKIVSAVKLSIS